MKRKTRLYVSALSVTIFILIFMFSLNSCSSTYQTETEFTPEGNKSFERESVDGQTVYELRRVFQNIRLEGVGIFENENEGLARSSALRVAERELAAKVAVKVESNTTLYNNIDVRDVIRTKVNAIVRNYRIDSAGYEPPSSYTYRVTISISGEQLIREIETLIK